MPMGLEGADEAESRSGSNKPAGNLAAPDPPNLRGTLLARPNPRLHFDVKTLDKFHTSSDNDDA
jgi:hypothetical protein